MVNNPTIQFQFFYEGPVTFSSVAAGQLVDQTVTVPGLYEDAFTLVSMPSLQDGLSFSNPIATAQNTLRLRFRNDTGGALTPVGTGVKIVQI